MKVYKLGTRLGSRPTSLETQRPSVVGRLANLDGDMMLPRPAFPYSPHRTKASESCHVVGGNGLARSYAMVHDVVKDVSQRNGHLLARIVDSSIFGQLV
ncbi:hypothetical protein PG984_008202 [Apiospora sp. TS-2023a]